MNISTEELLTQSLPTLSIERIVSRDQPGSLKELEITLQVRTPVLRPELISFQDNILKETVFSFKLYDENDLVILDEDFSFYSFEEQEVERNNSLVKELRLTRRVEVSDFLDIFASYRSSLDFSNSFTFLNDAIYSTDLVTEKILEKGRFPQELEIYVLEDETLYLGPVLIEEGGFFTVDGRPIERRSVPNMVGRGAGPYIEVEKPVRTPLSGNGVVFKSGVSTLSDSKSFFVLDYKTLLNIRTDKGYLFDDLTGDLLQISEIKIKGVNAETQQTETLLDSGVFSTSSSSSRLLIKNLYQNRVLGVSFEKKSNSYYSKYLVEIVFEDKTEQELKKLVLLANNLTQRVQGVLARFYSEFTYDNLNVLRGELIQLQDSVKSLGVGIKINEFLSNVNPLNGDLNQVSAMSLEIRELSAYLNGFTTYKNQEYSNIPLSYDVPDRFVFEIPVESREGTSDVGYLGDISLDDRDFKERIDLEVERFYGSSEQVPDTSIPGYVDGDFVDTTLYSFLTPLIVNELFDPFESNRQDNLDGLYGLIEKSDVYIDKYDRSVSSNEQETNKSILFGSLNSQSVAFDPSSLNIDSTESSDSVRIRQIMSFEKNGLVKKVAKFDQDRVIPDIVVGRNSRRQTFPQFYSALPVQLKKYVKDNLNAQQNNSFVARQKLNSMNLESVSDRIFKYSMLKRIQYMSIEEKEGQISYSWIDLDKDKLNQLDYETSILCRMIDYDSPKLNVESFSAGLNNSTKYFWIVGTSEVIPPAINTNISEFEFNEANEDVILASRRLA